MELRRFNDILGIKTSQGALIGFHSRNLEVADISEELWNGLETNSDKNAEAFEQLQAWDLEATIPLTEPPVVHKKIHSITLNVTQICNLACSYCAAGGDGTFGDPIKKISVEKTLPQLSFLLDKLESGDQFTITYLGGEPLLYPEGIQLIAEFLQQKGQEKNLKIKHRIVTNGTLLTHKNISLLAQIKAHVVVSIDGVKSVNDALRPMKNGKSSTDEIEQGLIRLQSVRDLISSLTLSAVFGKSNMNLLECYQFFKTFNPDAIELNFDHEETDVTFAKEFSEGFSQVLAYAFEKGGEAEIRKIARVDQIFTNLDQQTRVMNYCGAGKSFVMIDSKNNIFPCVWSPNKASETLGSGTYISESKRAQFQKPLIDKQGCNTCWARFLCGGGCSYVHEKASGSKSVPAEVFCFQSRSLISLAISYYQQCRKVG